MDPAIGVSDFEMRPTGLTVEIDPNYQGNGIDLNIAPELVRLARLQTYGSERFSCQQPIFETLRISTAVTAADGKPLLLGMHSLETARASEIATEEERNAVRDRRVLVFVTSKVKQM